MQEIYNKLIEKLGVERILKDEPMDKHTSFRIGGPADLFVKAKSLDELKFIIQTSKEHNMAVTVIGNGSNILVRDEGIRGIVVQIKLEEINVQGNILEAGAGVQISKLAKVAYENSLTGLEFAYGIPGTLGGAIPTNAGAFGGEIKDIIYLTTYLDENLEEHTIMNKDHKFEYRNSIFGDNPYIIISSKLKLSEGDKEKIKNKMDENLLSRITNQPTDLPNAGSIFKKGKDFTTAELIDKTGLKGYNIGDAYVSERHAGFIVNRGNAKAEDVLKLIEHIKVEVKNKYNKDLELEIKVI